MAAVRPLSAFLLFFVFFVFFVVQSLDLALKPGE